MPVELGKVTRLKLSLKCRGKEQLPRGKMSLTRNGHATGAKACSCALQTPCTHRPTHSRWLEGAVHAQANATRTVNRPTGAHNKAAPS
eukprot:137873-Pleurochrysis_carterae.AAC.1